tara:strand:+ start:3979 stop:4482 length:504 start_codon:yes stop_codon:yes gene_type:complete
MNKSDSIVELMKSLSVFQGELENIDKNKAGHGYKYATLGACIDAAKAPLVKAGLSVMQLVGSNEKGEPTMETVLGHSSGEFISVIVDMPIAKLQGGGGSNPSQILGASITYMRRYQYAAILGLAQEDSDAKPLTDIDKQWIAIIKESPSRVAELTDIEYMKYIVGNL